MSDGANLDLYLEITCPMIEQKDHTVPTQLWLESAEGVQPLSECFGERG